MALPLSNIAASLAANGTFQSRIKFFMQKAATAVIGEATPTQERNDYAVKVLNGSASTLQMSIAVVTNTTISSGINMMLDDMGAVDTDLEFVVNSLWDDFSREVGDTP